MAADGRENRWRLMTSPHIAERAEDWAQTGARHGLAFVFPLLDRRVVEFALSLPSELFLRGGFRRRPFATQWPTCCRRGAVAASEIPAVSEQHDRSRGEQGRTPCANRCL